MTSCHPLAPEETLKSTFPTVVHFESINCFTSASCVEERVGIVRNYLIKVPQGLAPDPAWHTASAKLVFTAASSPRAPGKPPLGDEALPVGCHRETIV